MPVQLKLHLDFRLYHLSFSYSYCLKSEFLTARLYFRISWPKFGKVKMFKLQMSNCFGRQYDKSANTHILTLHPQLNNYIWRLLRWVLTHKRIFEIKLFSSSLLNHSKDAIMQGSMFKWFEKSCAKKWEDALGGRKWREVASLNSCRSRTRGESLGNILT